MGRQTSFLPAVLPFFVAIQVWSSSHCEKVDYDLCMKARHFLFAVRVSIFIVCDMHVHITSFHCSYY